MTDLNAKPAGSIGEPTGHEMGAEKIEMSTEDYTPIASPMSTVEKAIWLHSDLSGFYFDKCSTSLEDRAAYLRWFERLQTALSCTDSLLNLLNGLLWGTGR